MAICAECKSSVEDGAVRCMSCGASLANAASFIQVTGWVLVAVSSIPIGLGVVAEGARNHVPLIFGGSLALLGLILAIGGFARGKKAPATTLPDEEGETFA